MVDRTEYTHTLHDLNLRPGDVVAYWNPDADAPGEPRKIIGDTEVKTNPMDIQGYSDDYAAYTSPHWKLISRADPQVEIAELRKQLKTKDIAIELLDGQVREERERNAKFRHNPYSVLKVLGRDRLDKIKEDYGSFKQSGTPIDDETTMTELVTAILRRYDDASAQANEMEIENKQAYDALENASRKIEELTDHTLVIEAIATQHRDRVSALEAALADVICGRTQITLTPVKTLEQIKQEVVTRAV